MLYDESRYPFTRDKLLVVVESFLLGDFFHLLGHEDVEEREKIGMDSHKVPKILKTTNMLGLTHNSQLGGAVAMGINLGTHISHK